jgi:hypothetical protein
MDKNLYDINVGEYARIRGFFDEEIEFLSSRMGVFAGREVTCIYKNGPIVITFGCQTVALDKNIAVKIYIM